VIRGGVEAELPPSWHGCCDRSALALLLSMRSFSSVAILSYTSSWPPGPTLTFSFMRAAAPASAAARARPGLILVSSSCSRPDLLLGPAAEDDLASKVAGGDSLGASACCVDEILVQRQHLIRDVHLPPARS